MAELAVQDPNITRLMQLEEMFCADPTLLRRYIIEERSHQDYLRNMEYAKAESRKEEKFATARRFKAMGLPNEQIAQGTGLSLNDIEAL